MRGWMRCRGFFGLFVRLARPIDFASIDGLPVDLVILLLTPANAGNQHLATLAALSRPLRDATFVQRLRQAPDADALYRLLANARDGVVGAYLDPRLRVVRVCRRNRNS